MAQLGIGSHYIVPSGRRRFVCPASYNTHYAMAIHCSVQICPLSVLPVMRFVRSTLTKGGDWPNLSPFTEHRDELLLASAIGEHLDGACSAPCSAKLHRAILLSVRSKILLYPVSLMVSRGASPPIALDRHSVRSPRRMDEEDEDGWDGWDGLRLILELETTRPGLSRSIDCPRGIPTYPLARPAYPSAI